MEGDHEHHKFSLLVLDRPARVRDHVVDDRLRQRDLHVEVEQRVERTLVVPVVDADVVLEQRARVQIACKWPDKTRIGAPSSRRMS